MITIPIPLRRALLLGTAALLGACDRPEAEPAPLGALPPIVGHQVGPQPGPNRALPVVTNPYADAPGAPVEGRRLFTWYNCEGCHGGHAGGGMGPSLRDAIWIYGNDPEDIYNSIAEGRAHGMPAWGTKLPSEQIWKLVAYVECLNRSCEPLAPPRNRSYPDAPSPTEARGLTIQGVAGGG